MDFLEDLVEVAQPGGVQDQEVQELGDKATQEALLLIHHQVWEVVVVALVALDKEEIVAEL
jgi:hypothetical protein